MLIKMHKIWIYTFIVLGFAANLDKIIYKQLEIDSPVELIVYCGQDQDIIILLSENNKVYRSENSGIS